MRRACSTGAHAPQARQITIHIASHHFTLESGQLHRNVARFIEQIHAYALAQHKPPSHTQWRTHTIIVLLLSLYPSYRSIECDINALEILYNQCGQE